MSNPPTKKRGREGLVVPVNRERVRELRIASGLTQREVASVADIDARTVSAIERGTRRASVPVLARLAKALRVQPDYLRQPEAVAA